MLINDWEKYLKDPASIDKGVFAPLLTDTENPASPNDVLAPLPGGPDMARRVHELTSNTIFSGLYYLPDSKKIASAEILAALAQTQLAEFASYLQTRGQAASAEQLRQSRTRIVNDESQFDAFVEEKRGRASNAIDFVADDFIDAYFDVDRRLSGAREAILHLTVAPYVTNYILNPGVDFPVTFRPGFDLYIGGGRMSVFDDELLVFSPKKL